MKIFELSQKENKNGRRKFKTILYQIFPDDCVDEINEVGTKYNLNGITWIEEYCRQALPSIKGMSLRAEFLDEERTELCGHGDTGVIDGLPIFENAVVIGTFDEGYIDDVTLSNGETIRACIGVGTIDGCCYHNFCEKLEHDIAEGNLLHGSVEIMKTNDNDGIVYKYGYKDQGRIPTIFEHSGYALLGVRPADPAATILELNKKHNDNTKEEVTSMNETEIKALITQTVESYSAVQAEMNQYKADCDAKVKEAAEQVETVVAEKNEAIANAETTQAALDDCKKELSETYAKIDSLYEEMEVLRKELGQAKAEKRVGEMNAAIANFSDDEKAYAQAEIDAFNADPVNSEINSVVSKIYEGIGKKTKEEAVVVEQNSATVEDIFAEVIVTEEDIDDTNIF